jgi:hypothetical protein
MFILYRILITDTVFINKYNITAFMNVFVKDMNLEGLVMFTALRDWEITKLSKQNYWNSF